MQTLSVFLITEDTCMRKNQENTGRILVWNHVSDKGNQINIIDDIFLCITYKEYNPRGFRNIYLKSNNETHFICINFYKFPITSINSKLKFSHYFFYLKRIRFIFFLEDTSVHQT